MNRSTAFKIKILALVLLILITVDGVTHKGLIRVMISKTFLETNPSTQSLSPDILLLNKNMNWEKAVNTIDKLGEIPAATSGIEIDVYFDTTINTFSVHHDPNIKSETQIEDLLNVYQSRNLSASIWFDFKNLFPYNQTAALNKLIDIRSKYHLKNKILVESSRPELLTPFVNEHFYTSYYTPFFNPYFLSKDSLKSVTYQIQEHLVKSKVQALSGVYFQARFLHERFPNYPVLIWGSNDRFSLVNFIFRQFLKNEKVVSIFLSR